MKYLTDRGVLKTICDTAGKDNGAYFKVCSLLTGAEINRVPFAGSLISGIDFLCKRKIDEYLSDPEIANGMKQLLKSAEFTYLKPMKDCIENNDLDGALSIYESLLNFLTRLCTFKHSYRDYLNTFTDINAYVEKNLPDYIYKGYYIIVSYQADNIIKTSDELDDENIESYYLHVFDNYFDKMVDENNHATNEAKLTFDGFLRDSGNIYQMLNECQKRKRTEK